MKKRRLIVVLGMHRSGTSAVTRGLKVLGIELGDLLIPANKEVNAKGFWEDMDLNALNVEMLDSLIAIGIILRQLTVGRCGSFAK